jgi:hypothetical protein
MGDPRRGRVRRDKKRGDREEAKSFKTWPGNAQMVMSTAFC